jgi:annexin A7/11
MKGDTGGDFERILVSLCNAGRSDSKDIKEDLAKKEAEALYQAGEKKMGTNEEIFNRIFCTTSYPQLRAVFAEYKKIAKKDIVKTIESERSGDAQACYKAVALVTKYRPAYFAKLLYKSMKGTGTNESQLNRVMIARSEIDMEQIEKAFHAMYDKKLVDFIKGDTSGDYENLLVALLH